MKRFSRRLPVSMMLGAPLALASWPLVASGVAARQAGTDDFSEAGLLSPTEYESPQFGYQVEWTRDWAVDPTRMEPVLWQFDRSQLAEHLPVVSVSGGLPQDRVDIWNTELDARFRFTVQSTGYVGAPAATLGMTSLAQGCKATNLLDVTDEETEERAIVHRHAMNDGSELLSYNKHIDVTLPDTGEYVWVWFQLLAPEDGFAEAYEQAMADIRVDAFALDGVVTIDEIMDAVEATPLQPVSEWGITSATSWEGLNFGVPVAWNSAITTRQNLGNNQLAYDVFTLGRTFGPYNDIDVELTVYDNNNNYDVNYLVNDTAEKTAAQGNDVLIARAGDNHGVLVYRGRTPDTWVYYEEFFVTDDGAGWGIVKILARRADGDDLVFGKYFGPLAGAITVNGIPFGTAVDPAAVIIAAQSDVEPAEE